MPCTNTPNSTIAPHSKINQRVPSLPRFTHAKTQSTCGTGKNACATQIKGSQNENSLRIRRHRTRRNPHPRRPTLHELPESRAGISKAPRWKLNPKAIQSIPDPLCLSLSRTCTVDRHRLVPHSIKSYKQKYTL